LLGERILKIKHCSKNAFEEVQNDNNAKSPSGYKEAPVVAKVWDKSGSSYDGYTYGMCHR
jgi:hypothetical protein